MSRQSRKKTSGWVRRRKNKTVPACIGLDFGTNLLRLAYLAEDRPEMLGVPIPLWRAAGLKEGRNVRLPVKSFLDDNEKVELDGQSIAWPELARRVFEFTHLQAEQDLGSPVQGCVVGVASMTGMLKKEILHTALGQAGFRAVRLINEPLAVALNQSPPSEGERRMLIYCMGTGSPDVSIAVRSKMKLRELASNGHRQLSGEVLTLRLFKHLQENTALQGTSEKDLWEIAEQVKIRLSSQEEVKLKELTPSLPEDAVVTRQAFEELIRPDLQASLDLCQSLLAEADLSKPGDLDEILLSGNSTTIPLLYGMLADWSGKTPQQMGENAVALGAAVHTTSLDFSETETSKAEEKTTPKEVSPSGLFTPRISLFEVAASRPAAEKASSAMRALNPHLEQAEQALAEGDYDSALRELHEIREHCRKQMADIYVLKAYQQENQGDVQSAQRAFKKALEIDPNHSEAGLIKQHQDARIYYREGRKKQDQKRYAEALVFYRKAYENHPENSDYRNACALMLLRRVFVEINQLKEMPRPKRKFILDGLRRAGKDLEEVLTYKPNQADIQEYMEKAANDLKDVSEHYLREG